MELTGPVVDVVERAYDVDASTPAWLEAVRVAAERSFSGQVLVQAYTFQVEAGGAVRLLDSACDLSWESGFRQFHMEARPETIRQCYLAGPVRSLWTAVKDPENEPAYVEAAREYGRYDIWAALGVDPSGNGVGLAFTHNAVLKHLPRPTRQALARIAAHLGSAHRLRRKLEHGTSRAQFVDGADAVLAPDGSVLHAEPDARDRDARLALRAAARRIDRAHLSSQRSDPQASLADWHALVDGRWSLVERFESDGRRILVARRNDPTTRPSSALTELERKVVAFITLGHSIKGALKFSRSCARSWARRQSLVAKARRPHPRKK
jgi:hypothetical protein